ncbi:MAG: hypothetical protein NT033_05990, partial [Candidatus Omnitrophica bacterium]|nr:hypothetical protein [Candidatus Omnitrophota bacterium]
NKPNSKLVSGFILDGFLIPLGLAMEIVDREGLELLVKFMEESDTEIQAMVRQVFVCRIEIEEMRRDAEQRAERAKDKQEVVNLLDQIAGLLKQGNIDETSRLIEAQKKAAAEFVQDRKLEVLALARSYLDTKEPAKARCVLVGIFGAAPADAEVGSILAEADRAIAENNRTEEIEERKREADQTEAERKRKLDLAETEKSALAKHIGELRGQSKWDAAWQETQRASNKFSKDACFDLKAIETGARQEIPEWISPRQRLTLRPLALTCQDIKKELDGLPHEKRFEMRQGELAQKFLFTCRRLMELIAELSAEAEQEIFYAARFIFEDSVFAKQAIVFPADFEEARAMPKGILTITHQNLFILSCFSQAVTEMYPAGELRPPEESRRHQYLKASLHSALRSCCRQVHIDEGLAILSEAIGLILEESDMVLPALKIDSKDLPSFALMHALNKLHITPLISPEQLFRHLGPEAIYRIDVLALPKGFSIIRVTLKEEAFFKAPLALSGTIDLFPFNPQNPDAPVPLAIEEVSALIKGQNSAENFDPAVWEHSIEL